MKNDLLQQVRSVQRTILAGETVTRTEMLDLMLRLETHLEAQAGGEEYRIAQAMKNLSYSEERALAHLIPVVLSSPKGLVAASQIADRVGITRSVIVNVLSKLESAGVIRSQSLGMKGTMVTILMPGFAKLYGPAA